MPETKPLPVKDLALDLRNYRTMPQDNEASAVAAMISMSPDRFWALTESLLRDGYLPTESILVLGAGGGRGRAKFTVKEGNRRIAALKLIHGFLALKSFEVPDAIADHVEQLDPGWRKEYATVPCTIYPASDAIIVDRIVTLAHGKGEKAGRDQWNAVARARHNRDASQGGEPALDLLEKYLQHGQNVTVHQRARWAGHYPLSVLAEAMKRLAPRLGSASAPVLAKDYPTVKHRGALEAIVHDIGQERLGFDQIRSAPDFAVAYGVPPSKQSTSGSGGNKPKAGSTGGSGTKGGKSKGGSKAYPSTSPKAVHSLLRDFEPLGTKREKVVTLRDEALKLSLVKTPLAFCFVLRSMFEISAKAYCGDHKIPVSNQGGKDKPLVDVLRTITSHLTNNKADIEMVKVLHGAMTELAKSSGLLSVTSMNQLVHNPRFSIAPTDLAAVFGNIFPLLEAMSS